LGFWGGVKYVSRIVFRISTWAFMSVVVIAAAYWTWTSWQDRRLEARISVAKTWDVKPLPLQTPVAVTLKTRCTDSRLLYQMRLEPKEEPLVSPRDGSQPVDRTPFVLQLIDEVSEYTVRFKDVDGFKVIEFAVPKSSLIRGLDDNGRINRVSADGIESCDRPAYERAIRAEVGWTGDLTPKQHPRGPKGK
jgi:hypothetical protein